MRQKPTYRGRTTVQVNLSVEQLLPRKLDTMRDADEADVSTGSRRADRLHHRLLASDRFDHRVRTESLRQLLDSRDALIAALRSDDQRLLARPFPPHEAAEHRRLRGRECEHERDVTLAAARSQWTHAFSAMNRLAALEDAMDAAKRELAAGAGADRFIALKTERDSLRRALKTGEIWNEDGSI